MTRHEYALTQGFVQIVADDDTEFWALDVETERGLRVWCRIGGGYAAQLRDENNEPIGPVGNGASMDAAVMAMLETAKAGE